MKVLGVYKHISVLLLDSCSTVVNTDIQTLSNTQLLFCLESGMFVARNLRAETIIGFADEYIKSHTQYTVMK